MKLTKKQRQTIANYNNFAPHFAENNTPDFWLQEFTLFRKYLDQGKILEIGSGTGREAKLFHQFNYDYSGLDASNELLIFAGKENPGLKFYLGNMLELTKIFPDNNFDGFWAAASLLHLEKEYITDALIQINKVTKANGIGFISMLEGTGERSYSSVKNPEFLRFFSYFKIPEFSGYLLKAGFKILEMTQKPTLHSNFLNFYVKVNNKVIH